MNRYRLQLLAAVMMAMGFVALIGWAGDYDWSEQQILRMTYEEYDWVKDTLTKLNGREPSEREMAHWWYEYHEERP